MQVVTVVLCIAMAWKYENMVASLGGSEFSFGRLTGTLVDLYDLGGAMFVVALLVIFFYSRIAAAITATASLLCFPIYLYFTVPGSFRLVFPQAEFSVPLRANFVWDTWSVLGILSLAVAMYVAVRSLVGRVSQE